MTKQRNDITFQYDVFISWTKKDEVLKNRIEKYLTDNGINCLVSDLECSGDFEEWSVAATQKCSVFLLVYTENTLRSKYVPLEIAEFLTIPDCYNRILPVCTDLSLYRRDTWGLQARVSACFMDQEDYLARMLHSVQNLLIHHATYTYRAADKPDYMKLIPLYRPQNIPDRDFDFSELYISRTLTQLDEDQSVTATDVVLTENDLNSKTIFISGGAGSGKTRYLDQLKATLSPDTLAITLACGKLPKPKDFDLVGEMFRVFKEKCGIGIYHTRAHFESLLAGTDKLLLILDGLDEIPNREETYQFINALRRQLDASCPPERSTLLVTSRNPEDDKLLQMGNRQLIRYRLDPLTEENIQDLSQKLFSAFSADGNAESFYRQVSSLKEEIRSNPLLLSQLAIVYEKQHKLPQTEVEIYDAIFSICLKKDRYDAVPVPDALTSIVTPGTISRTLKDFSRLRYESLSKGHTPDTNELFIQVLKPKHGDDADDLAPLLVEYLQNRAILVADDFYHKMFLEYFTAVSFFDQCFGDARDTNALASLFAHYSDPYWSDVIKLFLVKADSMMESSAAADLYRRLCTACQGNFTLLLDICRELPQNREAAHLAIADHLLTGSVSGTYPAYGPLFWYIPEYDLYEPMLLALAAHTDSGDFSKMLALARDVCFIFGQKNTVADFTDRVDPIELWRHAKLTGVRKALCEIFCTGDTEYEGGNLVYPRCFNVAEAKAYLKDDCGIVSRLTQPFEDEAGLFEHYSVPVIGDEVVGFVSLPYDAAIVQKELTAHFCRKFRGLALTPTSNTELEPMAFNGRHLTAFYLPENCSWEEFEWRQNLSPALYPLQQEEGLQYIRRGLRGLTHIPDEMFYNYTGLRWVKLPEGITQIGYCAFGSCISLTSVTLPQSLKVIGRCAFHSCPALSSVSLPDGLEIIQTRAFTGCAALTEIDLPDSITQIHSGAFSNCYRLERVRMPQNLRVIDNDTFEACGSLRNICLPPKLQEIRSEAFFHCRSLTQLHLPEGLQIIGWNAFFDCDSLEIVRVPDTVTELGHNCFGHCTNLELLLPPHLEALRNQVTYLPNSDSLPQSSDLADLLDDPPVQPQQDIPPITMIVNRMGMPASILPHQLPPEERITFLSINSDILTFRDTEDERPLMDCLILEPGVLGIGDLALHNSAKLEAVHMADVQIIGKYSFLECAKLRKLILPDSVTEIGTGAFQCCYNLTQVQLSSGLRSLGESAFAGCWKLTQINLPGGITEIPWSCFDCCHALTRIEIPEGVTRIHELAFQKCTTLHTVILPASLQTIADDAFKGCVGIKKVVIGKLFEEDLHRVFPDADQFKCEFI